jgi:hypothetical protein
MSGQWEGGLFEEGTVVTDESGLDTGIIREVIDNGGDVVARVVFTDEGDYELIPLADLKVAADQTWPPP